MEGQIRDYIDMKVNNFIGRIELAGKNRDGLAAWCEVDMFLDFRETIQSVLDNNSIATYTRAMGSALQNIGREDFVDLL